MLATKNHRPRIRSSQLSGMSPSAPPTLSSDARARPLPLLSRSGLLDDADRVRIPLRSGMDDPLGLDDVLDDWGPSVPSSDRIPSGRWDDDGESRDRSVVSSSCSSCFGRAA